MSSLAITRAWQAVQMCGSPPSQDLVAGGYTLRPQRVTVHLRQDPHQAAPQVMGVVVTGLVVRARSVERDPMSVTLPDLAQVPAWLGEIIQAASAAAAADAASAAA